MGLADVAIYNLLQSIKGNLLQLFLPLDRVFKNISPAATLLFLLAHIVRWAILMDIEEGLSFSAWKDKGDV